MDRDKPTKQVTYSGINKTEHMALDILKTRHNKIQKQRNDTPDFICDDTYRYEVKYIQSGTIMFGYKQANKLKDDDVIMVISDDGLYSEFKWKDRDKQNIRIYHQPQQTKNYSNLRLTKEAVDELDDMLAIFRDEIERYGYKPTRSSLIHYLYRRERENMVEALRRRGLDITTKEKLSELDRR